MYEIDLNLPKQIVADVLSNHEIHSVAFVGCGASISLGLTGLMYWLIKKNVNTGWLLVIAIVGGIALSAAGILA